MEPLVVLRPRPRGRPFGSNFRQGAQAPRAPWHCARRRHDSAAHAMPGPRLRLQSDQPVLLPRRRRRPGRGGRRGRQHVRRTAPVSARWEAGGGRGRDGAIPLRQADARLAVSGDGLHVRFRAGPGRRPPERRHRAARGRAARARRPAPGTAQAADDPHGPGRTATLSVRHVENDHRDPCRGRPAVSEGNSLPQAPRPDRCPAETARAARRIRRRGQPGTRASGAVRSRTGKTMRAAAPVRIGVSSCLLGERVRHDGGHKRDAYLVETLGQLVEWVPVCPEAEVGLGTPREPIRLVRDAGRHDGVRLVSRSGVRLTGRMRRFARDRLRALAKADLSGYILKKDSPSCGMERVKVWTGEDSRSSERNGRGIFAAELLRQYPNLPVEEEGRLHDPALRENFFERVFAYRRLRSLFSSRWNVGALVQWHTAQKLALMAHSPVRYRELGRLVAEAREIPRAELGRRYEDEFMTAVRIRATRARHTNALMHAMGHFKRRIDEASRDELLAVLEDYRRGLVPRIVPLTLARHHARRLEVDYLLGQTYLNPHPKELALLNHV
uniref:DUF1722 domain-containing protein n=1 Tax=Aplysina aerophoba bacterial symbiont clone AANRPS TaxID=1042317 RepID=F8S308_9BACT|nr:hypothetical protein [Aplysina aerophoba bacterial symbiont clone AANRPS]